MKRWLCKIFGCNIAYFRHESIMYGVSDFHLTCGRCGSTAVKTKRWSTVDDANFHYYQGRKIK